MVPHDLESNPIMWIYEFVYFSIINLCCGYNSKRVFLSPSFQSRKSNPGTAVQPTSEYESISSTEAANQEPALTTA